MNRNIKKNRGKSIENCEWIYGDLKYDENEENVN